MLKQIKPGGTFKNGSVKQKDVRTYRCLSKDMVELVEPSTFQKNMDKAYRSKKAEWRQRSKHIIEENWYIQRGFEVEEPEGKTAIYLGGSDIPSGVWSCMFCIDFHVKDYLKRGWKTLKEMKNA